MSLYRIVHLVIMTLVISTSAFAQKTQTQLITEINTNLASAKNISASTLRGVLTDMVNSSVSTTSVTNYGAKCDGSTDDTAAIQAAINAAEATAFGGAVQFPPSQCNISSPLIINHSNIQLIGSRAATVILLNNSSSGQDVIDICVSNCTSVSNIVIEGMIFERFQADSSGYAINAANIGVSSFNGIYIFGNSTMGGGFKLTNINEVAVSQTLVQSVIGACYTLAGVTTTSASATGPIDTLGTITGGSGGTPGTYFNVPMTGGSGINATATIVVGGGGGVTSVTLNAGSNQQRYKVGDVLSAASANIGSTTGFSVPVTVLGVFSNDFRLQNESFCSGGADGIVSGDWQGGLYIEGAVFYLQSNSNFRQSSTNPWKIISSYHFIGDDFDTTPNSMLWKFAWDVHIVGSRFGFNTTNVLNFVGGLEVTITGNNIIGGGAADCILLGDNTGVNGHLVQDATISGNMIQGCGFGVNVQSGGQNVSISGNTFTAQTSYNIGVGACGLVAVVLGINTYDASQANAPINYLCESDVYNQGGGPKVLGTLRAANFNSTSDQAISIPAQVTAFQITSILATNCSISMTSAQGGFYPAASKGGTAIVASTQAYSAATSSSIIVSATIATTPAVTRYTIRTVYLSLTTGQGSAATCDVYIMGQDLT